MTTTSLHPVDDFAQAVRSALADLPAEEVEDLTDGLEADLAERAADEENPDFGDPITYANELRSAAGLPPRAAFRPPGLDGVFVTTWNDLVRGLRDLYSHPFIARIGAFFISLRPIWWLVRAWAFYGVLVWIFSVPSFQLSPLTFVVAVGTLVLSVQWGRGKWLPRMWMRKALLGVNILLVALTPVILIATLSGFSSQMDAAYASGANDGEHEQNGLVYNGRSISNIFAYDADGNPLKQVQLYDQTGRPLYTVDGAEELMSNFGPPYLVPFAGKHGRGGWNVYPLGFVTQNQLNDDGAPKKGAKSSPSTLNDLLVPPLHNATQPPTPTPAATPTAPPTPPATPSPTPTN
ncbi:MAG TPA: hypothetical protein VGF80_01470 [Galbitalea sp.]|jgi:hypothetical protein